MLKWPGGECHAWQRRPPFPVNLRDLASLRLEGTKYSGRCTPLEYPLLDWYGPFGSSPPLFGWGIFKTIQSAARPPH